MSLRLRPLACALSFGIAVLSASPVADAFCGFYVAGADAKLFNNATVVVLMREGTRTVLSMQNNYQGPPENFAMVVPVPVVLKKENVKTLPTEVFDRVDHLAAPRLVEYWEQDPCHAPDPRLKRMVRITETEIRIANPQKMTEQYGVKIEARFSAGEYDIVILSAKNSVGLEGYLRAEKYNIPAGAAPYLRPYVTQGSKFFVAKVNTSKVKFQNGQAQLSPLRFHYDSETFNLPVRLGLINSAGTQDLIVHILAQSRYEVANYDNVTIPTNLRVKESAKASFGSFYAALFDDVLAKSPHAVVTEYAWSAGSCDPCPEPPLTMQELSTLGLDVLPSYEKSGKALEQVASLYTLTRLHARYDAKSLGEDLVFREAKPIMGGNGIPNPDGEMQKEPVFGYGNSFQGRYVMLHPWTGPMACAEPHRGFWGGPLQAGASAPMVATKTAFAPRGAALASFLDTEPIVLTTEKPAASASAAAEPPKPPTSATGEAKPPETNASDTPPLAPVSSGCASCTTANQPNGWSALLGTALVGLTGMMRRRRRINRLHAACKNHIDTVGIDR